MSVQDSAEHRLEGRLALVGPADVRLLATGLGYPGSEVVDDRYLGHAGSIALYLNFLPPSVSLSLTLDKRVFCRAQPRTEKLLSRLISLNRE